MKKQQFKEILLIIIGSLLFAIGVNYFAIPNRLSEGGVIGITVVTHYLFHWSPGIVNLVINGILLAVGYKFFERKTIFYTIYGIVFSTIFLLLTENVDIQTNGDTLLAALFAGVFVGVGIGLMFRAGGTSGGSAILARLAHNLFGWSIGKGMLVIDIFVIGGSVFIIGQEKAMYTLVAVFVGARVIDVVIEGFNSRTAVTIISDQSTEIRHLVTEKMTRGVTIMDGRGSYTEKRKEILYVVINKTELTRLKKIISKVDENAFVVVHDVRDVLGSGFESHIR